MTKKTKVLISGFEPFGGAKLNPSQLLVSELASQQLESIELSTIVLPVEFDRASEILLRKVKEQQPDLVIAFGQAEGRTAITPEKVAINLDDARIPDNSGDQRKNRPISQDGNDGYFSTLPVEEMVSAMKERGYPAELSLSAGAFVCNHIFYRLQRELRGTGIRSGFVHLPLVTEQSDEFPGKYVMGLSEMVNAVKVAIEATVS
ncbi:MAG: pyroglutamyl-peptidase I [Actinomycetota bacterium]